MSVTLTRDEIIAALADVVRALTSAGQPATIQLLGGAAIALTIDGDRPPTKDIDAALTPPGVLRAAAATVGRAKGWPENWLDEEATIFLPNQFGRGPEWVTLHDEGRILIQVASPRMLLAMKLIAFIKRPRRDADDVAILLAANGIASAAEAEMVMAEFYPGDELPPVAYERLEAVVAQGLRDVSPPPPPRFP